MGYCLGIILHVPQATGYGLEFWIRLVPSNGKRLANHTPHTRKWPHQSRLKGGATNLKRTNLENKSRHQFSA
jgi:hypothetical protein